MAGAEESDEELPAFAPLLQPLPAAGGTAPPRVSSPPLRRGSGVVVLSSDSEDEVEIVPLSERVRRRLPPGGPPARASGPGPPLAGGGDAAERDGLCHSNEWLAAGCRERALPKAAVLPEGGPSISSGNASGSGGPSIPPAAPLSERTARPEGPLESGQNAEDSPPPKKSKYSQEEREAICQAAWQRRKDREARKRQQGEEKERKKNLAKVLKAQRPGECQKYITVVLDPGTPRSLCWPYTNSCHGSLTRVPISVLLQVEGGAQIHAALQSANYSCVVESQAVPCSITWRRKSVLSQVRGQNLDCLALFFPRCLHLIVSGFSIPRKHSSNLLPTSD